jgi:hypothetical protein
MYYEVEPCWTEHAVEKPYLKKKRSLRFLCR